jgi:hypothetical protein
MAATVPNCLAATLHFRKNGCHLSARLENQRSPQSWSVVFENQLGPMQGGNGRDKAET